MPRTTRLRFESLESRLAMTGATAVLEPNGVLLITGTSGDDTITIDRTATQIKLVESNQTFSAASVKKIDVALRGGDDVVELNESFGLYTFLPRAPITLHSQGGGDQFITPTGQNVFFGGTQDTLTVGKKGEVKVEGKKPDWFALNVPYDTVGVLARQLVSDKTLNRSDMLQIFDTAAQSSVIGTLDFNALQAIGNNAAFFKNLAYVQCLSGYVVNPNVANALYQGDPLGNLSASSTGAHLTKLVDKWFKGKDHPDTPGEDGTYTDVAGSVFFGPPTASQVHQGADGDCYFLSAMNAIAVHNPLVIESMFIHNGDDTYTLRFYRDGVAQFITVDAKLAINDDGYFVYDESDLKWDNTNNVLWSALAEKAYAQLAELGWSRPGHTANSYASIDEGNAATVMAQITGRKAEFHWLDTSKESEIVKAWKQDRPVTFGSRDPSGSTQIVSNHDYALVGYDATSRRFQLSNPWGHTSHPEPAFVWLTWAELQSYFEDWHVGSKV